MTPVTLKILVMGSLTRLVPGKDCGEGDEATYQHGNRAERLGQCRENATEQAGYAESSNSGRPAAIRRIALPPAALQSDEQAYCQCKSEPCDQRIHGLLLSGGGNRQVVANPSDDLPRCHGAGCARDLTSAMEEDHGRDAADAEPG